MAGAYQTHIFISTILKNESCLDIGKLYWMHCLLWKFFMRLFGLGYLIDKLIVNAFLGLCEQLDGTLKLMCGWEPFELINCEIHEIEQWIMDIGQWAYIQYTL